MPDERPDANLPVGEVDAPDGRARIASLADELLPALIARLSGSTLGELEVREHGWHVRLRRAATAVETEEQPAGRGRAAGRGAPGAAHVDGRDGREHVDGAAAGRAEGAAGGGRQGSSQRDGRLTATSPAVGYFAPRDGSGVGQTVREGDVIGHIDVLGVRQEVVSPADGIVTRLFAEAGEAVEYGQELARVERAQKLRPPSAGDDPTASASASASGPPPHTVPTAASGARATVGADSDAATVVGGVPAAVASH